MYLLEKEADEKLALKEKFNTINSSRVLWGFSRFVNKQLSPSFNTEVSSVILSRSAFAKVPSVSHRMYRKVVKEVI